MSDAVTFLLWSAGMLVAALGWAWLVANEIFDRSVEVDDSDFPTESARIAILRGLYSLPIVIASILLGLLFGLVQIRENEALAAVLVIATTATMFMLVWRQSGARAAALAEEQGISIRFGGKSLGRDQ